MTRSRHPHESNIARSPAIATRWSLIACLASTTVLGGWTVPIGLAFEWQTASPESMSFSRKKLIAFKEELRERGTRGLLVIRTDKIVYEWYADGHSRTNKHYTASMAKALVGGVSLAVAISDGRISTDDPAARFVPHWKSDPLKSKILMRHLGSHTSGISDAWVAQEAADGIDQGKFSGWEGDFWRWRNSDQRPPQDAFTISRDIAPMLFEPGSDYAYSNPGIAMMTYAVTASLRDTRHTDIRSLLRDRIMRPIGVPDEEWSCGYGKTETVDGLPLVASWGGGSYSANATARVARLMLRTGNWDSKQLIRGEAVEQTLADIPAPKNGAMGWWTNANGDLGKAPRDAFSGQGAGHQIVFIVPSLDLICVRNGSALHGSLSSPAALRQYLFDPLINCLTDVPNVTNKDTLPYPPSQQITGISWKSKDSIVRLAEGSDNWPLTWADDDAMYTAYGDGWGFEPKVAEKLSLGLARIEGGPDEFHGVNVRSATAERTGQGLQGEKASGMLMVDGVLYMWIRNAGNSQLGWSNDHGKSWSWADWKFSTSFGCPSFLNFGRNYAGARDEYAYVYSHDSGSAYDAADTMVLARVPILRIKQRGAYEFFATLDNRGNPLWTEEIEKRGAVFSHRGSCYRGGMTYNPALKRYLWCQVLPESQHAQGPRFEGGFGICDAAEPWGPWTTAFFTQHWDVGPGETSCFPTKWMSVDGKTIHLVFSGNDCFSVRKATLSVYE